MAEETVQTIYDNDIVVTVSDEQLQEGESREDSNENAEKFFSNALKKVTKGNSSKWKESLSGALDNQHLFGALIILSIFYIGYTIGNAFHNNDNKDEDKITTACECKSDHRTFYVAWFYICTVFWLLCHIMVQIPKYWETLFKELFEKINCFSSSKHTGKYNVNSDETDPQPNHTTHPSSDNENTKSVNERVCCRQCFRILDVKIKTMKKYLTEKQHWEILKQQHFVCSQYYELYVIGITKGNLNRIFNEGKIQKIFNESLKTDETDQGNDKSKAVSVMQPPMITALRNVYSKLNYQYCIQCFLHGFLLLAQFIAQSAVVPLLLIQVFDTYSFLCFTDDSYCTLREEYSLHLDKTIITFAFYCSLTISYLSSTMLNWIPWATTEKKPDSPSQLKSNSVSGVPIAKSSIEPTSDYLEDNISEPTRNMTHLETAPSSPDGDSLEDDTTEPDYSKQTIISLEPSSTPYNYDTTVVKPLTYSKSDANVSESGYSKTIAPYAEYWRRASVYNSGTFTHKDQNA